MGETSRELTRDEARDVVVRHYRDVLAYCRRHTPCAADAEDAAQETFLRFVRARPRYRDRGRPLAYLLTIARNVCADAARAHARDAAELPDDVPDDAAGRAEERSELALALERLPPDEREALELRYGGGLRVGEVAEALGVSRFAASRKIRSALAALRRELGDGGQP